MQSSGSCKLHKAGTSSKFISLSADSERQESFHWRTSISYKTRERIVVRGYDINELARQWGIAGKHQLLAAAVEAATELEYSRSTFLCSGRSIMTDLRSGSWGIEPEKV
jgi:citrate synthase